MSVPFFSGACEAADVGAMFFFWRGEAANFKATFEGRLPRMRPKELLWRGRHSLTTGVGNKLPWVLGNRLHPNNTELFQIATKPICDQVTQTILREPLATNICLVRDAGVIIYCNAWGGPANGYD